MQIGFGGGRGRNAVIFSVLLGAVSGLALTANPAVAQEVGTNSQRDLEFDIPQQPLVDALRAFSDRTGIQAVYTTASGAGVASPGVRGRMSAGEALSRLLAGTGLTFRYTGPRSITLEAAPATQGDVVQLGPVRVQGNIDEDSSSRSALKASDAVTERTKSYTSNAVTIGKTVLNPRDIPQSVSVVTRQRIEDQNLFTLTEALAQAPGITVTSAGTNRSSFTARGFNIDNIQIDGIPNTLSYNTLLSPDLAMYDRVEIIRGSNGLLQGTGDPSASINLVRKRPSDTFAASASLSAGSWNNYRAEADVGGPLNGSQTLRARIVGSYQDNDYFYDVAFQKKWLVYGVVDFRPTPGTTITAGYTYLGSNTLPNVTGLPFYSDGGDIHLRRSTFLGANWSRYKFNNQEGFVEIKQDLGHDWLAQLVYRHGVGLNNFLTGGAFGAVDRATGTGAGLDAITIPDYRDQQNGIDGFVTGKVRLFGRDHSLVFGANARDDKLRNPVYQASAPIEGFPIDVFNPNPDALPDPAFGQPFFRIYTTTRQAGIYGTARLSLADPLTLIVGARISWWSVQTEYRPPAILVFPTSKTTKNGIFSPYLGVVYKLADTVSLYASYADIFQPQTRTDFTGKTLSPVVGSNYEAGIKFGPPNGRLNGSLALFQIEQTNRGISDPAHPTFFINTGKVRSRGFEAEITGSITDTWNISAGYTYTETKYLRDPVNEGVVFNPFTPKHLFKVWSNYTLPGDLSRLSVGGGITGQSRVYIVDGGVRFDQGGYVLANARIGYEISDNVSASVNLNNLFDRRYYSTLFRLGSGNHYGEPRNFTVTIRGKF